MVPTASSRPMRSSSNRCALRLDSRYRPVSAATVAVSRGPKLPCASSAGTGARVLCPHFGHSSSCSRHSWTTGFTSGKSMS